MVSDLSSTRICGWARVSEDHVLGPTFQACWVFVLKSAGSLPRPGLLACLCDPSPAQCPSNQRRMVRAPPSRSCLLWPRNRVFDTASRLHSLLIECNHDHPQVAATTILNRALTGRRQNHHPTDYASRPIPSLELRVSQVPASHHQLQPGILAAVQPSTFRIAPRACAPGVCAREPNLDQQKRTKARARQYTRRGVPRAWMRSGGGNGECDWDHGVGHGPRRGHRPDHDGDVIQRCPEPCGRRRGRCSSFFWPSLHRSADWR